MVYQLAIYPRYHYENLIIRDNHTYKNLNIGNYINPSSRQNLARLSVKIFNKNPNFQIVDIYDLLKLNFNIRAGKCYFLRAATFEDCENSILEKFNGKLYILWVDSIYSISGITEKIFLELPKDIDEDFIKKNFNKIAEFIFDSLSKNIAVKSKLTDFEFFMFEFHKLLLEGGGND